MRAYHREGRQLRNNRTRSPHLLAGTVSAAAICTGLGLSVIFAGLSESVSSIIPIWIESWAGNILNGLQASRRMRVLNETGATKRQQACTSVSIPPFASPWSSTTRRAALFMERGHSVASPGVRFGDCSRARVTLAIVLRAFFAAVETRAPVLDSAWSVSNRR